MCNRGVDTKLKIHNVYECLYFNMYVKQKYIKVVGRVVLFHCTSSWTFLHLSQYFHPNSPIFSCFPNPTPKLMVPYYPHPVSKFLS